MNTLEEWTVAARARLGLDPGPMSTAEIKAVLDMTRDGPTPWTGPPAR